MAHENNFLVAAGGDVYGPPKLDIPLGVDVMDEQEVASAIPEKRKNA